MSGKTPEVIYNNFLRAFNGQNVAAVHVNFDIYANFRGEANRPALANRAHTPEAYLQAFLAEDLPKVDDLLLQQDKREAFIEALFKADINEGLRQIILEDVKALPKAGKECEEAIQPHQAHADYMQKRVEYQVLCEHLKSGRFDQITKERMQAVKHFILPTLEGDRPFDSVFLKAVLQVQPAKSLPEEAKHQFHTEKLKLIMRIKQLYLDHDKALNHSSNISSFKGQFETVCSDKLIAALGKKAEKQQEKDQAAEDEDCGASGPSDTSDDGDYVIEEGGGDDCTFVITRFLERLSPEEVAAFEASVQAELDKIDLNPSDDCTEVLSSAPFLESQEKKGGLPPIAEEPTPQ